jgi:hypothetical protein
MAMWTAKARIFWMLRSAPSNFFAALPKPVPCPSQPHAVLRVAQAEVLELLNFRLLYF